MQDLMRKYLIIVVLSIALGGCVPATPEQASALITKPPATQSTDTIEPEPATATVENEQMPVAVEYNLGETTITQSMFSEDSRFRNMPVRLNGIIAVPAGEAVPSPVTVILHGNHPGCPVPEGDTVDRWPCDLEVERPNYRGFDYLVSKLAEKGYVALSININADNTFGFGEPVPIERLGQLVDLHLKALSAAAAGGANKFGVDLAGRADMSRLAFIGHSQGGEGAFWLTQKAGLDTADAFAKLGYGPVYGLLLVAPSANYGGATSSRVPLAVILPACDGDVFLKEGQLFYEITRFDLEQNPWASSVWLERANHNYFNGTLQDESVSRPGRPDCDPVLQPEAQRDFLSAYTIDFLAMVFNQDPAAVTRLGMDLRMAAPDELYGLPARVAALAPHPDRLPLFLTLNETELDTNLAGGDVTIEGLTITYCKEGYYVPTMKPGSEPCKRVNLVIPGNPAMIVASWSKEGGVLRFSLPEGRDLSLFSAISLRAALDPLSPLNKDVAFQAFTIQVVDQQGNTASMQTRIEEPALRFPEGNQEQNDTFEGGWFTGRVPLTTIRIPLNNFVGVDLSAIQEIALLFDQVENGSLFISDLEIVR